MKNRRVYRRPPCPRYDIEGIEHWLESMAQKGLLLVRGHVWGDIMEFRKAPATTVRYRLDAADPERTYNGKPFLETQETMKEFGWDYVTFYNGFFIYRSTRPDSPEINTDPELQASSLNALQKKNLLSLFPLMAFFHLCMTTAYAPAPHSLQSHIFHLMNTDSGRMYCTPSVYAMFAPIFFLRIVEHILYSIQLLRVQRTLRTRGNYRFGSPWKARKVGYWILRCIRFLLILTIVVSFLLGGRFSAYTGDHGKLPFATLQDVLPEDPGYDAASRPPEIRKWSDMLLPVNYEWAERISVSQPDGTTKYISLHILYHEAITEDFASHIAKKYTEQGSGTLPLSLPDLDYSCAFSFIGSHFFPGNTVVVLQNGKAIVYAYVDDSCLETWAGATAELMK